MFMQKIEVPVATRPRASRPAKMAAGLAFVLFSALVMPPFLAGMAVWLLLAAAAQLVNKLVRGFGEAVDHAGELIVGR